MNGLFERLFDRWLLRSWLVIPFLVSALLTYGELTHPTTFATVDTVMLTVGGAAGFIACCFLLRRQKGRWPVLVAAVLWFSGAAMLRGLGFFIVAFLEPPFSNIVPSMLLHIGALIVLCFGILLLAGVTPQGQRAQLLQRSVRQPFAVRDDDDAEGDVNTDDRNY